MVKQITINISTLTSFQPTQVKLSDNSTILQLKVEYEKQSRTIPARQRLYLDGNGSRVPVADDTKTLSDYGIKNGSNVLCIPFLGDLAQLQPMSATPSTGLDQRVNEIRSVTDQLH